MELKQRTLLLEKGMCKISDFKETLSEIASEHKKLFFTGCIIIVLLFILFTLGTRLLVAYNTKTANENKITEMQTFIKDYDKKMTLLKDSSSQPVAKTELEKVQTSVLFNMQKYALNLKSLKEPSNQQAEKNGHIYQVELEGDFNNTINFLKNFSDNTALIGIKALHITMKQNLINSKLTYKIYTVE